jgi:hypothetical protein
VWLVAGCVPPDTVNRGKARFVAALRGVVEPDATAVAFCRAGIVADISGMAGAAVTDVARGESHIVDSGTCLFDLAVHTWRCAATRN